MLEKGGQGLVPCEYMIQCLTSAQLDSGLLSDTSEPISTVFFKNKSECMICYSTRI